MDGAIFIIVPHLSGSRRIREVLRKQASIKSKRGREGAMLLVVEHCVLLVVVEQLPINLKSHLTESCTSSQREDHRITFKDRVKRKVSLAS